MTRKLIAAFAVLALSGPALAQSGAAATTAPAPARTADRARPRPARNFDPATVTTVSGKVTAVHKLEGRRGNEGVHVDLAAADATYDVHLGPAPFLAGKSLDLKEGDAIEVTGSKVVVRGKPALIAQSVKKGEVSVTLRDAQGLPAWRGTGTGRR